MRSAARTLIACWIAVAIIQAAPAGHRAKHSRSAGSISGCVIDALTRQPLGGVEVTADSVPEDTTGSGVSGIRYGPHIVFRSGGFAESVVTESNGTFTIAELDPGAYEVRAVRTGWAGGQFGQRESTSAGRWIVVADGRPRSVEIRMWRQPTIAGRVTEENGRPIPGAQVTARGTGSSSDSGADGTATTDDRGMFLLSVEEGDYVIAAEAPMRTYPRASRVTSHPATLLRTTFYGQAASVQGAAHVIVGPADDRASVDIVLVRVPSFRITGVEEGFTNGKDVNVLLFPVERVDESAEDPIAVTQPDSQGRFEFPRVAPGLYSVRSVRFNVSYPPQQTLTDDTLWDEQTVAVEDRDVHITIAPQTGVRIRARIAFDGTQPPSFDPGRHNRLAVESTRPAYQDILGICTPDWQCTTGQLTPGPYRVRPYVWGWTVKSVLAAGRELGNRPLEVGASDADVLITLTNRFATISGQLRREPPFEATRGWIAIFPVDRSLWPNGGCLPRQVDFTEPGVSGRFAVTLLPGSYYIVAAESRPPDAWSPNTFERLAASATVVTVGPDQTVNQELRIRAVRR